MPTLPIRIGLIDTTSTVDAVARSAPPVVQRGGRRPPAVNRRRTAPCYVHADVTKCSWGADIFGCSLQAGKALDFEATGR